MDLQNRRILVVEDDYFLAADLEENLAGAGAIVVGPVATIEAALELIERTGSLDGAVLDVNLGGKRVFPVADKLMARGVPFLFATGYSKGDIPPCYADAPIAEKPVDPHAVASTLVQMLPPAE